MKKLIILFIIILVFITNTKAQAPHSFKYQAIARDNKGEIIASHILGMRITLLQGDATGGEIYVETHEANSNKFGLINLEIGNGTVISGDFNSIDWSKGPYFVKIEMDESGGDNYKVLGTSQLLSVPYALYAEKAGNFNIIDTSCINLCCSPWIKNGNKIYYNKGNVGIGTSDPGYLLDIQGDAALDDIIPRQFVVLHNKNNSMHSNVALHFKSGTDMNEAAGSVGVAAFSYNAAPGLKGYTYLYSNYSGIALRARNSEGIIKFITGGNEVVNERMRIDANGNIGIGTKEPANALSIEGSEEEWPGRIFLSIKNKSTSGKSLAYLKIFAGGDEYGTSLGHISNTYTANGYPEDVQDYGRLTSSGNGLIIDATKPDREPGIIKFCNGMTSENIFIESMRIDKSGNIGIGTKEPKAKLHIKDGDIYINCLDKGIIMKSPDGQCWKITVGDGGSIVSSPMTCPE